MTGTVKRAKLTRADLALWDGRTKTYSRIDASGGTVSGLVADDEVDVLQVFGAGTNRTRTAIADAIRYITTSNSCTLLFSTGTWTIDDNLTIPSNFTCHIPAGCVFSVSSGKTLTFSGPIQRESETWTAGSGTVSYTAANNVLLHTVDLGITLFPRTAAEIAASVTPVNYSIVNDYTGKIVPDRFTTNTTPGTTDMTLAIQKAESVMRANGYGEVSLLGTTYLVTGTVFKPLSTDTKMTYRGIPLRTTIINKASANKPTFQVFGSMYWDIEGFVLIGATGFPNIGIEITKDGSGNRSGFGVVRRIVCQTNGGGIHITDTNTMMIDDYQYWPSGGSSFGGTIDANGQPYGILADGAGGVNDVLIRHFNASGINTIANGGCAINIDGRSGGPFYNWKIDRMTSERSPLATQQALWVRNVTGGLFQNLFTENNQCIVDQGCVAITIDTMEAGNTGSLQIDGSGVACNQIIVRNSVGKGFTCDAANARVIEENNVWGSGTYTQAASQVTRTAVTSNGVVMPDLVVRSWIAITFAAGDYTATSGNWTLTSGDVSVARYLITGNVMRLFLQLVTTTVSATPAALQFSLPGGYKPARTATGHLFAYSEDNGTTTAYGLLSTTAGSGTIQFLKNFAASTWATTANLTQISLDVEFEIQ